MKSADIKKLIKVMGIKLSTELDRRILKDMLQAQAESRKAETPSPSATGKIVPIKKTRMIPFAVLPLLVASASAGTTNLVKIVAAAVLLVSASAGTKKLVKILIDNPQSQRAQELSVCDDRPSEEIAHRNDDEVQIEDRTAGRPPTVGPLLGNKIALGLSTHDDTQSNIFDGTLVTGICAYDPSPVDSLHGLIDSALMEWGNSDLTLSVGVGVDLDILDSSILTIDESCLNYNFGEISDAKGLLTGILSNGDTVNNRFYLDNNRFYLDNNRFYLDDGVSTVVVPAPGSIILAAIGLGTLASIRRRLR